MEPPFRPQADPHAESTAPPPVKLAARQGVSQTSLGLNIGPDAGDGWEQPQPVQLADGTLVRLYKDGEALLAAYDAIKSARRRICLEVYIFASDDTGRAFADLLASQARRGIEVSVIYDSFGSIDTDPAMFESLRKAGVMVRQFHPMRPWECDFSWRPINRDHRKLLMIDEEIAGLGGLNIAYQYAGSWVVKSKYAAGEFWRDDAVALVGPSAGLFEACFSRTWQYIHRGGRIRRAEFSHALAETITGSADLGILASVPTISSRLRPLICNLLQQARESILMTMAYFAPDDPLIDELCKAARLGVRVRLMLPGRCDIRLLRIAAHSFYERLLEAGVEIYERQGVVLHAKSLVVDRRLVLVGSMNLDYRSIEYNCELSMVIRSVEFGRQMSGLFEHDVRFAEQIRLGQWRSRPWLDRVGQWAVSRARYLL
ncbi:MAG TPA: phospholipase D-like domain-containing protein [Tepidisphaeraceae bacterium]|jgi:cardiolipin synthase|nr:phospholipase D-like domain-containing protein [Tepidisphaeraceae bacterium]